MKFGEQIRLRRQALDMTQSQVAEKLFVTRQTVSNWEQGKSYPDLKMLVKVSKLYQVSIDSLLKDDQKMKEYLNKSKVLTAFNTLVGLVWILYGVLVLNEAFISSQLSSTMIDFLASAIMGAIIWYQSYKEPMLFGIGKEDSTKLNWYNLFNWIMIIAIYVPLIIAIFTNNFISSITRSCIYIAIGIANIILAHKYNPII